MSAEIIWSPRQGEPKKTAHPDALSNLNEARDFYKTHFFSKEWNLSMTKNDSQDNVLIWIWWTPPIGSKLSKISYPITTHQPRKNFLEEMENAYDAIYQEACRHHDPKIPFHKI
jgi:hypothetical protein